MTIIPNFSKLIYCKEKYKFEYDYKTASYGRIQIVNHMEPCVLCARYDEMASQFKIKTPSVLEMHVDRATYIHCAEWDNGVPLWLSLTGIRCGSKHPVEYSGLHQSLQQDFANDDDVSSLTRASSNIKPLDNYVISYSLYVDDLTDFPLYWLGLKMNIDAAKAWFPGWAIHLFVEDSFRMNQANLLDKMLTYAANAGVSIKILTCQAGAHPMLERYRPLLNPSGVCVVRDVDSILSLTDAKIIDAWLRDEDRDVLIYSEHKMHNHSCGGGVAVKLDKKLKGKEEVSLATVIGPRRGRNQDEHRLHKWLRGATDTERWAIVQVRMTSSGGHYWLDYYRGSPKVLWANSFGSSWSYDMKAATKSDFTMDLCEEACKELLASSCSDEYVHSHTPASREKFLKKAKWAR